MNYFWHHLQVLADNDDIEMEDLWFQNNGATCHIAQEIVELLEHGKSLV